jgi:hypothetical protein
MKKLLITLLLFTFYCNSSFANSSFEKKLAKTDELVEKGLKNPKQMQKFLELATQGYTKCTMSSNGSVCKLKEQLCLITQNNNQISIRCLNESDLDYLLSPI